MFSDVKNLFFEKVVPEYQNYIGIKMGDAAGRSQDVSAAINSATSLFHLREHVPEPHRKSRSALAAICPDYDLVADISNVSKHAEISRNSPQITKAENIYEQIIITEYRDDDGPYRIPEKTVIAKLDNGTERHVEDILTNVINMWVDQLIAANLIDSINHFPNRDTSQIPQRTVPGEGAPLDLSQTQGLGTTVRFQLKKYNYDTGEAKPVDLTDSSVSFKIYEQDVPKESIDMTFTHPTNGDEQKLSIDLTAEEAAELKKLKGEDERTAFVFDLAEQRGHVVRKKRHPFS